MPVTQAEQQDGAKRLTAREMWAFFGPAFVASVAYIDPGNFASNIVGGARYGYTLLWVLLWPPGIPRGFFKKSAAAGVVLKGQWDLHLIGVSLACCHRQHCCPGWAAGFASLLSSPAS